MELTRTLWRRGADEIMQMSFSEGDLSLTPLLQAVVDVTNPSTEKRCCTCSSVLVRAHFITLPGSTSSNQEQERESQRGEETTGSSPASKTQGHRPVGDPPAANQRQPRQGVWSHPYPWGPHEGPAMSRHGLVRKMPDMASIISIIIASPPHTTP